MDIRYIKTKEVEAVIYSSYFPLMMEAHAHILKYPDLLEYIEMFILFPNVDFETLDNLKILLNKYAPTLKEQDKIAHAENLESKIIAKKHKNWDLYYEGIKRGMIDLSFLLINGALDEEQREFVRNSVSLDYRVISEIKKGTYYFGSMTNEEFIYSLNGIYNETQDTFDEEEISMIINILHGIKEDAVNCDDTKTIRQVIKTINKYTDLLEHIKGQNRKER